MGGIGKKTKKIRQAWRRKATRMKGKVIWNESNGGQIKRNKQKQNNRETRKADEFLT